MIADFPFRLSFGEKAYILDDSKPKVYFYDSELKDTAEKALNMAKHKPSRVVMVDVSGKEKPFVGSISYEEYVRGKSETDPDIKRPTWVYSENRKPKRKWLRVYSRKPLQFNFLSFEKKSLAVDACRQLNLISS